MGESAFWMRFVVAILATWRVAHLLAREDGPGNIVVRVRARLGGGPLGRAMDCFHCLSFWVAAPIAFFVASVTAPVELVLTCLALSGAACLLERFGHEPVMIQPITEKSEGDLPHGMLRTAADDARQPRAINGDALHRADAPH
jgi:hypothetical protein